MAIDFKNDGTIAIEWDGRSVVIPSPTIGDYRKLRNHLDELANVEESLRTKFRAAQEEVEKEPIEAALRDHVENWVVNWLNTSLDGNGRTLLGDQGDPETWPAWLTANALPGRMLTHWRTLPLASGAPKIDASP